MSTVIIEERAKMYANAASKMKPIPEEGQNSPNWRSKLDESSEDEDEDESGSSSSGEPSSSGSSDGYESDWEKEVSEVTGEVFYVDPFTEEELARNKLEVSLSCRKVTMLGSTQ